MHVPVPSKRRSISLAGFAATVFLLVMGLPAPQAAAKPTFQMPFPCGQTWSGQTRTNHSPTYSVDFNRSGDSEDIVVAAAAGTVTVQNEGNESYGLWIEIDHGGGWTTRYAHLSDVDVSDGDQVSQGQAIGNVGTSGGSTGPHLHFEERSGGNDVRISFNGNQISYFGTASYTSRNSCDGATGTVNTESGVSLNVRAEPTTSSASVGSVADGETVTIECQTRGETITGTYGTSDLWNHIGTGYIADAYVYTGSDGRVAPSC